jgi:hypothetical protein
MASSPHTDATGKKVESDVKPRRFARTRKVISWTLIVIFLLAFLFTLFVSTNLYGTSSEALIYAVVLTVLCYNIAHKHRQLGSSAKRIALWMIFAAVALVVTILFALPTLGRMFGAMWTMPNFLGVVAFAALLVFGIVALPFGFKYAIEYRKISAALFLGELYLIASTLSLYITSQIAMMSDMQLLKTYGNDSHRIFFVLFWIAIARLIYVAARRPDWDYTARS